MKKLTTQDIINHLNDGAVLQKVYCVYSYWRLILADGTIIYDGVMRKGSPESAKSKIQYEIIEQNKNGYSIKIKNQKTKKQNNMENKITFWKNNRIDMEHEVAIDEIIADFLTSKQYENFSYGMPFHQCILIHMATYGSFDAISHEQWQIIHSKFDEMESRYHLQIFNQIHNK